jgi:hypothetical protein
MNANPTQLSCSADKCPPVNGRPKGQKLVISVLLAVLCFGKKSSVTIIQAQLQPFF